MAVFADKLDALLQARGWNQPEAATHLGLPQGSLSRYLSGATVPSVTKVVQIAARLGVPVEELTGEVPSEISSVKTQVGRHPTAAHQIAQLPAASLKRFKNRYRAADPDLRKFMSAQVRALFGTDAKKILTWLNSP